MFVEFLGSEKATTTYRVQKTELTLVFLVVPSKQIHAAGIFLWAYPASVYVLNLVDVPKYRAHFSGHSYQEIFLDDRLVLLPVLYIQVLKFFDVGFALSESKQAAIHLPLVVFDVHLISFEFLPNFGVQECGLLHYDLENSQSGVAYEFP